jgi:hypothetical protein
MPLAVASRRRGRYKIDASGVLVDGQKDGPRALRQALASQPDNFIIAITEKMLT